MQKVGLSIYKVPWYLASNKVSKDKRNNERYHHSSIEFVMAHSPSASDTRPFPFNAQELVKVGYPDRLFQNIVLMPALLKSKLVKAGPDMAKPKSVLDRHQQSSFTWASMFLTFCELHTPNVVLIIGSSVGVGFLILVFWLPTLYVFNFMSVLHQDKHIAAFQCLLNFFGFTTNVDAYRAGRKFFTSTCIEWAAGEPHQMSQLYYLAQRQLVQIKLYFSPGQKPSRFLMTLCSIFQICPIIQCCFVSFFGSPPASQEAVQLETSDVELVEGSSHVASEITESDAHEKAVEVDEDSDEVLLDDSRLDGHAEKKTAAKARRKLEREEKRIANAEKRKAHARKKARKLERAKERKQKPEKKVKRKRKGKKLELSLELRSTSSEPSSTSFVVSNSTLSHISSKSFLPDSSSSSAVSTVLSSISSSSSLGQSLLPKRKRAASSPKTGKVTKKAKLPTSASKSKSASRIPVVKRKRTSQQKRKTKSYKVAKK